MDPAVRGWSVTLSGAAMTVGLGVLYAWGVVAQALSRPVADGGLHGWAQWQAGMPFAVSVAAFAATMVLAGGIRDVAGPRWTATAGGVLVGLGMVVASLSPAHLPAAEIPWHMVAGFGVMTGIGVGLAYSAVTPAAVKWFAPRRRGLIVGTVVAGFGFSPLVTAPLAARLIASFDVERALLFLGIGELAFLVGLAQLLADPLPGFVPPGSYAEPPGPGERSVRQMLRSPGFFSLWAAFAISSMAGLLGVGLVTSPGGWLGGPATGIPGAQALMAVALGNGVSRPLAGLFADRAGRGPAMIALFAAQIVSLSIVGLAATAPGDPRTAIVVGLSYGAALALFPTATYDLFGTRNAGADYGLVFSAWGVGGLAGWILSQSLPFAPAEASGALAARAVILGTCALLVGAIALTYRLRHLRPAPHGSTSAPPVAGERV